MDILEVGAVVAIFAAWFIVIATAIVLFNYLKQKKRPKLTDIGLCIDDFYVITIAILAVLMGSYLDSGDGGLFVPVVLGAEIVLLIMQAKAK